MTGDGEGSTGEYVYVDTDRKRVETEFKLAAKPAGVEVSWIPGYWAWENEDKDYLWVSGFWRDMPPDRRWVPGTWQEAADED